MFVLNVYILSILSAKNPKEATFRNLSRRVMAWEKPFLLFLSFLVAETCFVRVFASQRINFPDSLMKHGHVIWF